MADDKPLTGGEYAAFAQTDAATFFGMRQAMADAVFDMKAEEAKAASEGRQLSRDEYTMMAKSALMHAAEDNELLKAAGTDKVVEGYFIEVVNRQGDKDAQYGHVKAFLDNIDVDREDVDKAQQGKLSDSEMISLGSDFLKSAKDNLGVKTLTEDFQHEIKTKPHVTDGMTVTPGAFSAEQANLIDGLEGKFRVLDNLDDALSKIGLGEPAVNQYLAPSDPAVEAALSPVVEAASRLSRGASTDIGADIRAIEENAAKLPGAPGVHPEHDSLSPEEAKAIGQSVLNGVVEIRSGAVEATSDNLLRRMDLNVVEEPSKEHGFNEVPAPDSRTASLGQSMTQAVDEALAFLKDTWNEGAEVVTGQLDSLTAPAHRIPSDNAGEKNIRGV